MERKWELELQRFCEDGLGARFVLLFAGGRMMVTETFSGHRDLAADRGVHVMFHVLRGDPDGVLDGIRVGRSVADEGYALQPEQRSATVFRVIQTLLEVDKRLPREQEPDL